MACDPVAMYEFKSEYGILARLRHQNIIKVIGAGCQPRAFIGRRMILHIIIIMTIAVLFYFFLIYYIYYSNLYSFGTLGRWFPSISYLKTHATIKFNQTNILKTCFHLSWATLQSQGNRICLWFYAFTFSSWSYDNSSRSETCEYWLYSWW